MLRRRICAKYPTSLESIKSLQVLPDSWKGQRKIGSPGSRQDVGGPGPAGTAVFQTAYGPHDQLSATVRADALWAAPDNAGQPAGLIPVYTTGLMLSAARSFRVPTQRVGTRKTASGITFYNTLPRRARQAMDGRIPPDRCGECGRSYRMAPRNSISFKQFKSYRDARLPLALLSLLIGANASGKSNAVEGIRFLSWLAEGRRLDDLMSAVQAGDQQVRGTVRAELRGRPRRFPTRSAMKIGLA